MPPCAKAHLRWQHCEMALPRSSALQKGHAHCPCDPFLPTTDTARQRARRVPRGTGASNLLRVSHRNAGITRTSSLDLRTNCINSNRSRLTQRRREPHANSFAPMRRNTGLSTGSIETRSDKRPPIRSCIHYQILWLSRFTSGTRLESANRDPI